MKSSAPTGAYVLHRQSLIRSARNSHTTELECAVSPHDLDALNAVQETPWRINTWILDIMLEAWTTGQRVGGLEVGEPLSLPPRLEDGAWASFTEEEKRATRAKRSAVHAMNARINGRSQGVLDCLSVADELRNEPSIWYPHVKDFRHRIYPAAAFGPHPQGSDISKSLLMFAEGIPLGPDGLFWLCVRAANAWGYDKATLEERVAWTLGHKSMITACVSSPLSVTDWWTKAADPWSFLATCYELTTALSQSETDTFVSHLPIPLDGSCNGLQHLAAMGLDPIGATATNLRPSSVRQDIYEEVAKRVRLAVEQDILDDVPEAALWQDKVTRQTVKRAVMTTPYGVTDRGIRDQLILDGHASDGPSADYLKDKLVSALSGTVRSARDIMGWLQTVANALAKAGLPFDWTTPTGSRVRQGYHTALRETVSTLVAEVVLYTEQLESPLNARKQSAGAAPNYVHSFDAAHLSKTVNAAHAEGITSFSMIHDSYGTHAAHTTRLSTLLREAFVDIYREDWLRKTYEEVRSYAPHVEIPEPPQRGEFDITEVLDAPFFFS